MTPITSLDQLNTEQLRSLAAQLLQNIERLDKEVLHQKNRNQQLIHEIAQLKRHRFAKRAQSFSHDQASSLDELIDADIAAIEANLKSWQLNQRHLQRATGPGSQGPAAGTSRYPLCEL
ncbi:transposase [Pseudomonas fragi]|uniref:transposase n=1 Tax=Pseudomonas fragi TaxID=296 RepID=UPI001F24D770|nr:transposase [Pseudomonas fragi]MCF6763254.1 transposase [Pseudomonas fragi]